MKMTCVVVVVLLGTALALEGTASRPTRKMPVLSPLIKDLYVMKYPYQLPPLPFDYAVLEPHIDAKTMEIHYTKHHQTYVDTLNQALSHEPLWQKKTLQELLGMLGQLPASLRTAVSHNGGGHLNHTMFWSMLSPSGGGEPSGALAAGITKEFGSYATFKERFNGKARTLFGSGWVFLSVDPSGRLQLSQAANHDSPLSEGLQPILCFDVWEHAYYLKYQNRRVDYLDGWWGVINWPQVEENYRLIVEQLRMLAMR